MADRLRVACIQNRATPDLDENLARTSQWAREAADQGAELIALPEYFSGLSTKGPRVHPVAFPEHGHPALAAFSALARETGAWLLLGSLGVEGPDGRIFNRSYVLDDRGEIVARYDKIHLFDVDLAGGHSYRESETIAPGNCAVLAETPWGHIGLTVCHDLRFPALYRSLAQAGAAILAVPAAFTRITGEAHWHTLNRARAIENGCFVISPCQTGLLDGGGECFGHSLVVDPWGRVLADGGVEEGVIVTEIDSSQVQAVRGRIPSLSHDRPFA